MEQSKKSKLERQPFDCILEELSLRKSGRSGNFIVISDDDDEDEDAVIIEDATPLIRKRACSTPVKCKNSPSQPMHKHDPNPIIVHNGNLLPNPLRLNTQCRRGINNVFVVPVDVENIRQTKTPWLEKINIDELCQSCRVARFIKKRLEISNPYGLPIPYFESYLPDGIDPSCTCAGKGLLNQSSNLEARPQDVVVVSSEEDDEEEIDFTELIAENARESMQEQDLDDDDNNNNDDKISLLSHPSVSTLEKSVSPSLETSHLSDVDSYKPMSLSQPRIIIESIEFHHGEEVEWAKEEQERELSYEDITDYPADDLIEIHEMDVKLEIMKDNPALVSAISISSNSSIVEDSYGGNSSDDDVILRTAKKRMYFQNDAGNKSPAMNTGTLVKESSETDSFLSCDSKPASQSD